MERWSGRKIGYHVVSLGGFCGFALIGIRTTVSLVNNDKSLFHDENSNNEEEISNDQSTDQVFAKSADQQNVILSISLPALTNGNHNKNFLILQHQLIRVISV